MSMIFSYGYNDLSQHPNPADTVLFDCRDIPEPKLMQSGLDEKVRHEVMSSEEAQDMVTQATGVAMQGRFDVAFMCTVGFQRSVALAQETADRCRALGVEVEVEHRSLDEVFKNVV